VSTITVLRTVLEQALEAMNKATRFMSDSDYMKLNQAIDALRAALPCTYKCEAWPECACAALAQEEQEPVAWQWLNSAYFRRKPPANAESGAWNPLYTHPPRREWQSLSEEEINELSHTMVKGHKSVNWLARAIEQALKEKNHD